MIMREGMPPSAASTSGRQPFAAAYFLDSLGDSHKGLGQHEAAIEAHRQAAEGFRAQGAQCSYALCLFKVATSHLALGEPWHAVGYLEACLPLLSDLGLTRHEGLARHELDACHAELAGAHLLAKGRASARLGAARPSRPTDPDAPGTRRRPGDPPTPRDPPTGTLSPYLRDKGRFTLCPGSTDSRAG